MARGTIRTSLRSDGWSGTPVSYHQGKTDRQAGIVQSRYTRQNTRLFIIVVLDAFLGDTAAVEENRAACTLMRSRVRSRSFAKNAHRAEVICFQTGGHLSRLAATLSPILANCHGGAWTMSGRP
jgi:hypothetical protein